MRRVAIAPADRLRGFVIVPDVSPNLASEIRNRGKNAAREEIALDLREPELDLVQPRRVGRGEMQPHSGMLNQKRSDRLRFMGREVIGDHMNRSPLGLAGHDVAEELDKGGA